MPDANGTGNLHLSSSSRNMQLIRIAPSMPSSCTERERWGRIGSGRNGKHTIYNNSRQHFKLINI